MKQFILTENGNLLRFHETLEKPYFESPQGEFLRECSMEEFNYLSLHGIQCESIDPRLELEPEFFPTWNFLKSVKVTDDYSNYRPETSNNGGNYSFHTYHDWYVAKMPRFSKEKWRFCFVERQSASAEFEFDELAGSFQSDLGVIFIQNCQKSMTYITQIGSVWDEDNQGWHYQVPEVLEKIAIQSTFEHLWNENYLYIPSNWDENDVEKRTEGLSLSDKKEILQKLKELDCDLREGMKRGFVKNNHR